MKIRSTQVPVRIDLSTSLKAESQSALDLVRDTFHRGYTSTMIALPGAVRGGLLGASIGFANGLPLAAICGLKPSLIAAGALGIVGSVVGGVLSHSLAQLD
jgi:outer membrane lipoprotein SlyB